MSGKYNIVAEQGATFNLNFRVETDGTPWDLTGYTFDADIRIDFGQSIAASLVCTVTSAIAGKLNLSLTAATTLAITAGVYLWDLKLKVPGVSSYYYAKGTFTVTATVSRD